MTDFNPLTPFWTLVTIVFEAGVLGGGSWFVFCKVIPYLSRHETLHEVSQEEHQRMQNSLFGIFAKAKRWPDYPIRFMASYTMKGVAFILLFAVLAILLTSIGWVSPLSLDGLYYDLLFARSNGQPNGAHLVSYLPIPIVGIYVAWKYRTDILLDCYLGLLVAALGVAIHESIWIVGYYAFYWQYLSWGVLDNVIKDVFFAVMLGLFLFTFIRYPFQKISLNIFRGPTMVYCIFLLVWGLAGFHISTINNFIYGQGIYGETQWWGDPLTNAFEVGSWDLLYVCMMISVWRPHAWDFLLKHGSRS